MNYFSRSKIFLFIMITFVAGIFLGNYLGIFVIGIPATIILLNCYIIILLLFLFRKKRLIFCFLILLLSCFFGVWRYQSYLPKIDANHVGYYVDGKETYLVEGVVDTEPAEKNGGLQLQISNIILSSNDQIPIPNQILNFKSQSLNGKILVSIPKYYEVKYGDQVKFGAKLAKPSSFETFNYSDYLARYGVYAVAKIIDSFEVVSNDSCRDTRLCVSTIVQKYLYQIKDYFSGVINRIYPEPHASFILGILIGAKTALPDWLTQLFQIIGITHIIAISGYNITVLAKVAEKTLGKLGRKYIFLGVISLIICFVIMTGAQVSIVRAGIMGGLLVYAGFIGRRSNAANVLVFAGAVMIFLNPLILKNDIGFQLSFLATMGLVYISPIFEKWLAKIPGFFRELLCATLSAQVLTLPIIISSFGKLSLISPIANVIILPFVPVSMFVGFLSGFIGILFLPLGKLIGFFGYIILDVIIKLLQIFSLIPYAAVEVKVNNCWVWAGYYLVVGILIWFWYRKNQNLKIRNQNGR